MRLRALRPQVKRDPLGGGCLRTTLAMSSSERWSWGARRLGMASSIAILIVGILYIAVITLWLIIEATREPIGDPYLAVMAVLTIASALALVGLVVAIWCFADTEHRLSALTALAIGTLAAAFTVAVHFVQLTAVRQLWRAGGLADYRLAWPSALFAIEYFAWDVLVGFTLVFMSFAVAGRPGAETARRAMLIGGGLCLVGVAGPFSGRIFLQNIGVLGYAVVLPIASALTARMFRAAVPGNAAA